METDELAEYLESLKREDCYRVEAVLKESPFETTQRVSFVGANGSQRGPYIRKFITRDTGLGAAYERIFAAQQSGRRFKYVPVIMECYRRDDCLVVVMELVRGETLQDFVYRADPSLALAASVFPRLCDAVTELHEEFDPPIIHRDLKPSNIVLSGNGLAIIDYGIARDFHEGATADTTQFGTRAFAPPEQFGFGQTTVRSDVYALGMLLFYCLTETIPTAAIREARFADPRVPEALREVIAKATALDPADRFESAAELRAVFLKAYATIPVAAAPEPALSQPALSPTPALAPLPNPLPAPVPAPASAGVPANRSQTSTIGHVRNSIIGFVLAVLLVACVNSFISPGEAAARNSVQVNAYGYFVFLPMLLSGTALLLCDKTWIRHRFARFRDWKLWKWLAAYAALWAVMIFGLLVIAVLFPGQK